MVRSADDRIWKRYLELIDQAHELGLNPVVAKLPIARDELKLRGTELVDAIEATSGAARQPGSGADRGAGARGRGAT